MSEAFGQRHKDGPVVHGSEISKLREPLKIMELEYSGCLPTVFHASHHFGLTWQGIYSEVTPKDKH